PRLLDDVLGVGRRAEHLVGDGEEQAAVGDERVGAGAHDADGTPVRSASGASPQAAAKPSDSMPRATLPRGVRLAKPPTWVSSTTAASPSCRTRLSTIASVTATGVAVIASAYSSTSRSSGENTEDSRQRGISRALSRSRPLSLAMK